MSWWIWKRWQLSIVSKSRQSQTPREGGTESGGSFNGKMAELPKDQHFVC